MTSTNASYTVLARRYRPQTFDDVIGQQHVAQALKNAISSDRVAHAYLFTGARGVGKTSMARILAKALNCPHVSDGIPCNACEICEGIAAGRDVDVMEIDGASNRGIDDIRALRANVNVKSMRTKYKMYIIDEVHMLTKEAFNALLKTLEEPPPRVKFVFCTTEPHKVPDTILSRCQRFDFASVATQNIAERLTEIANQEGISVEPEAIELVARRADGSMRDSQSLFDQLLAFGGDPITSDDVHRLLGTATDARLIEFGEVLISGDAAKVFPLVATALGEGVQIARLADQLMAYLRDLMALSAHAEHIVLLSVSDASRTELISQAKRFGLQRAVTGMQLLAEAKSRMTQVSFPQAVLELSLVRISQLQNLEALATLLGQIRDHGEIKINSAAASLPVMSPEAAPQKKSPEIAPNLQAEAPESSQTEHQEPQSSPQYKFTEESLDGIWRALREQIDPQISSHLQSKPQLAISGPNELELTFSKKYNFSKQYLETKIEVRSRIEAALETLTAQPIRLRFRLSEADENNESLQPTTDQAKTGKPQSNYDSDAFVRTALGIFGGGVVKYEPIVTQRIEPSASTDSADI